MSARLEPSTGDYKTERNRNSSTGDSAKCQYSLLKASFCLSTGHIAKEVFSKNVHVILVPRKKRKSLHSSFKCFFSFEPTVERNLGRPSPEKDCCYRRTIQHRSKGCGHGSILKVSPKERQLAGHESLHM